MGGHTAHSRVAAAQMTSTSDAGMLIVALAGALEGATPSRGNLIGARAAAFFGAATHALARRPSLPKREATMEQLVTLFATTLNPDLAARKQGARTARPAEHPASL